MEMNLENMSTSGSKIGLIGLAAGHYHNMLKTKTVLWFQSAVAGSIFPPAGG